MGSYRNYCRLRNIATTAVRDAKQQFELNLARESVSNPRGFHAYVRSKTTIKEEVMALKGEDGTLTTSLPEVCELLNKEFEKVFIKEDDQPIPSTGEFHGLKLTTCAISEDIVKEHLEALKTPSAPGPDNVHPMLLKNCATELSKPLTLIYRESLRSGQVPEDWTSANITPIFKKGNRSHPLNYRPVSLTSVPSKILERIIRNHIMNHLEINNFLSNHQHGFRSGMSCLTQLLEYFMDLENALDEGDGVDVIYLDCRKAFDTVPHKRLLVKLKQAGIEGQVGLWIQNFLTDRQQRVAIRGTYSGWRRVWSGVPQGSVLGPTLFLIFVNDLLDNIQSSGKLFADDAKLYRRIRDIEDKTILQQDLDKLHDWSNKWLLQFNEEKCKVMHVGRTNAGYQYHLGSSQLMETQKEKDLGVLVTPDLKSSAQVAKAAASANSVLGRIKRTFSCLDKEVLLPLYKSVVRPRLEFAVQAWSPYTRRDINILEAVQRRATKLVPSLAHLSYEDRLSNLGLSTLEARRRRGDMIEAFKILKGFDKVGGQDSFLKLASSNNTSRPDTRGHSLKLEKTRHRTTKRAKFFSSRIVNEWNSLPEEVIDSPSVNTFKNRYDRFVQSSLRRGTSYEP